MHLKMKPQSGNGLPACKVYTLHVLYTNVTYQKYDNSFTSILIKLYLQSQYMNNVQT